MQNLIGKKVSVYYKDHKNPDTLYHQSIGTVLEMTGNLVYLSKVENPHGNAMFGTRRLPDQVLNTQNPDFVKFELF